MLRKKVFLEILQNSQENTCATVSLLSLRPATLLKKRLCCWCFLVNFVKFLRTPFLQNTSGQLLLNTHSRCSAGLQSGTSLWFHFLRFFLLGTPIFRITWECFLLISFLSLFFLIAMCQVGIYSLCLFVLKNQPLGTFFYTLITCNSNW